MADCELLATCGFFDKYRNSLDMACKGFLKTYCYGPQMVDCKRKAYRQANGKAPLDDMLPTGQMMPEQYRV